VPVEAHIKEHAAWFHRFDVIWTPAILIFSPEGVERFRIEGYLPNDEFRAQLELGLARVSFMEKKWDNAQELYKGILQHYSQTAAAPEAQFWVGVSRYKATRDHTVLGQTAQRFNERYQESVWAKKASIWGG
jgi:hypothetical protein